MTYMEIQDMVASIGLPNAYYEFPAGTDLAPPFVCYLYTDSNDLAADNTNYQRVRSVQLELYTKNKDFALEQTVEAVLNAHDLFYSRNEGFLDAERMNMVTYTFDVVITD